jgi:hypothetical protein
MDFECLPVKHRCVNHFCRTFGAERGPQNEFPLLIMTRDENGCNILKPEKKRQSLEWHYAISWKKKKIFEAMSSGGKDHGDNFLRFGKTPACGHRQKRNRR